MTRSTSREGAPILEQARDIFRDVVRNAGLADAEISVLAKPLTPEEAIGQPGRRDYPIITGKERVVEAVVEGSKGQAFTDSPREFLGTLGAILELDLQVTQNRAIFIAALNAVMMHLEMIDASVHCKDEDPERCAGEVSGKLHLEHPDSTIGLVGLNPAIAENLVEVFGPTKVVISDLDPEKIGTKRFGVVVMDGAGERDEFIDSADTFFVTGTTIVNGTFDALLQRIEEQGKRCILYGVTAAGVSRLLDLQRICPFARRG